MKNPIGKQAINSLFTWATSSWYTKIMFGFILLIITIRLSTTCISILGMEIGCEDYISPIDEYATEYGPHGDPDVFDPKMPPKE